MSKKSNRSNYNSRKRKANLQKKKVAEFIALLKEMKSPESEE